MDVLAWLDNGDPAIRWQALHDLADDRDEAAAVRARVAESGWGRRLLDLEQDGRWAGGACFPARDWRPPADVVGDRDGQPWTGTYPTLRLLMELGIDPTHPDVRAAVQRVQANCRWEYGEDLRFFDGEVEPCINGGTVAIGAYFGVDVSGIVQRLLGERLADGGWNCEATEEEGHPGSTRSSFHTTICVLEGLLEYERTGGTTPVTDARRSGEEYLLARSLMRRASTGDLVDPSFLEFSFPTQWYYDVLRALDYFRRVGGSPDPRVEEALGLVRRKQQADGTWLSENTHPGLQWFELEDGDGSPSRWNTLRALRVLRWYEQAQ